MKSIKLLQECHNLDSTQDIQSICNGLNNTLQMWMVSLELFDKIDDSSQLSQYGRYLGWSDQKWSIVY
jgi:hypothetical protein